MAETISWEVATGTGKAPLGGTPPAGAQGNTIPWEVATGQTSAEAAARNPGSVWDRAMQAVGSAATDVGRAAVRGLGFPALAGGVRATDPTRQVVDVEAAARSDIPRDVKRGIGAAANMVDMVPGTVAQVVAIPLTPIAAAVASAKGATRKEAASFGKEFGDVFSEKLKAPFSSLAKLNPDWERAYSENPVGFAFGKLSEWMEHGGKGIEKDTGMPSEWVDYTFNSLMGLVGLHAGKGSLKASSAARAQGRANTAADLRSRNMTLDQGILREENLPPQPPGEVPPPEEMGRAPSSEPATMTVRPEEKLGVTMMQRWMKAAEEARLKEEAALAKKVVGEDVVTKGKLKTAFENVVTPEQAIAESKARIAAQAKQAEVGQQVGQVEKGRIAEPTIIGQPAAVLDPVLDSAMTKVSADGRALLSVEERLALKRVATEAGIVDHAGKPIRSNQGGRIDQDLLVKMAGVTGGLAVAIPALQAAWNHFNPNEPFSWSTAAQRIVDKVKEREDAKKAVPAPAPESEERSFGYPYYKEPPIDATPSPHDTPKIGKPSAIASLGAGAAAAGLMGMGDVGAAASSLGMGAGMAGIFARAGKNHPNTLRAMFLEKEGVSRDMIWKETGVGKMGGEYVREISDHGVGLKEGLPQNPYSKDLISLGSKERRPLENVLDHPRLYKQYPAAGGVLTRDGGFGSYGGGFFNAEANTMGLGAGKAADVASVALHEVQHYIQSMENLPRGGSPSQFLPPDFSAAKAAVEKQLREYRPLMDAEKLNQFTLARALESELEGRKLYDSESSALRGAKSVEQQKPGFMETFKAMQDIDKAERAAYEKYKELAGEVQSRLVQKRRDMTPEERRDTPPWKQYDVPEENWRITDKVGTAGMVLGNKGMPHPKLLRDLSGRIWGGHIASEFTPANAPIRLWADKAISKFLQKGKNEVADVEIPFGEETRPFGDLLEKSLNNKQASLVAKQEPDLSRPGGVPEWLERVPGDEPVYVRGKPNLAFFAVNSYLSHVGDYLIEHVPPAKLGQMDLARAIRETAKWDKELAAKMDKARLDDTAGSPVYKDYGDGMRWVQLTKAGQFARESDTMGHSVRGYEPPRSPDYGGLKGEAHPDWTPASGNSGHAGYGLGGWEAIKSGDAKVYSLRDAKGESHATVEVGGPQIFGRNVPRAVLPDVPARITQIKGKQNLSPAERYLPYVQDFVKGGKWGEVRDLQHTGLMKATDIELSGGRNARQLANKDYLTTDEANALINKDNEAVTALQRGHGDPFGNQRGSIDPELLKALGATAGGAALGAWASDKDSKGLGALVGAGAGALASMTKGGRKLSGETAGLADDWLGTLSTRMRNISEPFLRRARAFEEQTLTRTHEAFQRVGPFLTTLNKLPEDAKLAIDRALINNGEGAIQRAVAAVPGMKGQWEEVKKVLAEVGGELRSGGWISHMRDDYFPRIVTDVEGLLGALGKEISTRLEDTLTKAEKASQKVAGRGLSEIEKSIIINKELRASAPTSGRQGFTKARGVEEVTPELESFYASPTESLHTYLKHGIFELEKAKFFGKDLVRTKSGNVSYVDIDQSIGNIARKELKAGTITQAQMVELHSMLRSRFTGGEKGAAGPIQLVRNLTNAGLLGNVVSAATQLSDTGMAAFHADMRGTVSAIAQKLRGTQRIQAKDYGLADRLSEEFVSTTKSAKFLAGVFKYSLFKGVDLFGKDTLLNAVLNRAERLAITEKGQATLIKEHGRMFEGDMTQLIDDLRNKQLSPLVKELLFNKLSDAQPITKLEVPQKYLDMPNGRIIYMLKTFMLKQADIARVSIYNEIARGNVGTGMKNLLAYGTALGVSGATIDMVKDAMLGRPFDARWEDIPENALKTFGWSEYTRKMAGTGHPLKAVGNIVAPPFQLFDEIWKRDPKAVNYIPLFGKLIYPHTDAGEMSEAKRIYQRSRADNPAVAEKSEKLAQLKKERMADPRWRAYYLAKMRGEAAERPEP